MDVNLPTSSATAPDIARAKPTVSNIVGDLAVLQLRNFAAFMKAQQAMLNGNKALFGQQIDISRSTITHFTTATQDIMSGRTVKAVVMKCCDSLKSSVQDDIGDSNILSEMNARSNVEAAQIIQTRAFEAFDEMQQILGKVLDASPIFAVGCGVD